MTEIYGASDDLIEFKGDFGGEVGHYSSDEDDRGVLLFVSDGTLLRAYYGERGVWHIEVLRKGDLYDSHETCTDPDAERYSDTVRLKPGIKWVYAASGWENVK